jgi:glutamine synthetase
VLCDLVDEETGTPVEVSPRRILRRQVERAAAAGYTVKCGSELEFFLFRDSYEEAAAKGYAGLEPHSPVIEDYHVLQTTRDEYLIRDSKRDGRAAVPVEFSKGEAGGDSTRSTSSTPTRSRWPIAT